MFVKARSLLEYMLTGVSMIESYDIRAEARSSLTSRLTLSAHYSASPPASASQSWTSCQQRLTDGLFDGHEAEYGYLM